MPVWSIIGLSLVLNINIFNLKDRVQHLVALFTEAFALGVYGGADYIGETKRNVSIR